MAKHPSGHDWDQQQPQPQEAPGATAAEGVVRVRCIVDTLPWTDRKSLERDEEALVPQHIADAMVKKKQVEIVKGG